MFSFLHKKQPALLYAFLPHAVFVFFVACFLLHPLSPLYTHRLSDPDDTMRLNQVINWLRGQSWYDLGQPRLSPGDHTVIHWSRLVDLPIAFVMLPLIKLFGMQNAALLASFVVPPILFIALLFLTPALARPLTGAARANLASVFLLFAPMVLFNFTPGRVDHHGYQILIAGFGLYCLTRIARDPKDWRWPVASAASFACGLWIGAEAVPWLCVFLACLALLSAEQGGRALRAAAIFGAALPAAATAILFVALPRSEFSSRALSWFSPAYVIFAAFAGGVLIVSWLLGQYTKNRKLRFALVASLGFFAALLFIYLVPGSLDGPFADYDNFNSTVALDNINEARPLWHALWIAPDVPLTWARAFAVTIRALLLPFIALGTVIYAFLNAKRRERPLWLMHGAFLAAAIPLTLFWQVRVGYFMEMFAIAPLVWLLDFLWDKCKALKNRPRFWAEIFCFMLLGPLPVVLLPAMFQKTDFYPDVILFPAARQEASCPLKPAADFLDRTYAGKDITLMAGMNEGPELLFLTPFKTIGGNYNVEGNRDVFDFFHASDDAAARKILRRHHADLVLLCRDIPPFMAGFDHPRFGRTVFLRPGADGKLHLGGNLAHPPLIERLVNGRPPDWLKPVEIPDSRDYLLFQVKPGRT